MDQFQEPENPIQAFVGHYKLSPAVEALVAGGQKNVRVLRARVQELLISEKMALVTGPQDLSAACFSDPREAFECIMAQMKLQVQPSEFDMTALEPLAVFLYGQEQMAKVGKRLVGFFALGFLMFVGPWVLHKCGLLKANKPANTQ